MDFLNEFFEDRDVLKENIKNLVRAKVKEEAKIDENFFRIDRMRLTQMRKDLEAIGYGILGLTGAVALLATIGGAVGVGLSIIPAVLGFAGYRVAKNASRKIGNQIAKRDFDNALETLKSATEARDNIYVAMKSMTVEEAKRYMKSNQRQINNLTLEQRNAAESLRTMIDSARNEGSPHAGVMDDMTLNAVQSMHEMIDAAVSGRLTMDRDLEKTVQLARI